MQFRFQLGAIGMSFVLLQFEFLLIMLIIVMGQLFIESDLDMLFNVIAIAVACVFLLGHFKTTLLIIKNMDNVGSDLKEVEGSEDPLNLIKNGMLDGMKWRVFEEIKNIKEISKFNFSLK